MKTRDMTELEVNGVLFIGFPINLSLDESLERLELEIKEAAFYCDGRVSQPKDEYEVEISPGWIFIIDHRRKMGEIEKMKDLELASEATRALNSRKRLLRLSGSTGADKH